MIDVIIAQFFNLPVPQKMFQIPFNVYILKKGLLSYWIAVNFKPYINLLISFSSNNLQLVKSFLEAITKG